MSDDTPTGDPLLDEVDEVRRRIFAESGYDLERWFADLLEYQKQFADRLVDYGKEARPGKSAA